MPPKKVFGDGRDDMNKSQRCHLHKKLQDEAKVMLGELFPNADVEAVEKSIMGPVQDHLVGFAHLKGVLHRGSDKLVRTWYAKYKAREARIFDNLPVEDPNYGKKCRQDASARFFIDDVGEPPSWLGFDAMDWVAARLRYERLGPVGIVFSEGRPDHWDQRAHCDHDPRLGSFGTFFDRENAKKPVLSMLAPLSAAGMRLDIWGTEKWYRMNEISLPLHPVDLPIFTIFLEPGDAILFRYDLIHAGCGYPEDNFRLFCTFRAHTGAETCEMNTTWQMTCKCVDELKRQCKETPKTACTCPKERRDDPEAPCTCGAHACKCPKRTKEAKLTYDAWRQGVDTEPVVDLMGRGRKRGLLA